MPQIKRIYYICPVISWNAFVWTVVKYALD